MGSLAHPRFTAPVPTFNKSTIQQFNKSVAMKLAAQTLLRGRSMPKVHFVKQDVTVECPVGTNLRELALANEIDLYAFPNNIFIWRGFALCGTCRVKVEEAPAALA